MGDGHSDSYRQTYHASTGNTHAHGILVDVLAKFEGNILRLAAQGLDSLSHTEGHGAGFGTAGGENYLLLHYLFQLLADTLFHSIIRLERHIAVGFHIVLIHLRVDNHTAALLVKIAVLWHTATKPFKS